jgi:hypothetical protein
VPERARAASTSANVAQGAEAVSERIARALHYPACWDTAAYPTLESAVWEAIACAKLGCSTCEPAQTALADAARDVLAERQRQVTAEGWTPEHDDAHDSGQLAGAASCYAAHVNGRQWVFFAGCADDYKSEPTPDYWPWDESWWKPTTPRRDLIKAAALILAEIERLDRTLTADQSASGDTK